MELNNKPAPLWGLYAIMLRAFFISILWMLPRAIMGLQPLSVPILTFLTTQNYYWHAIWIYPVFDFSRWLLFSAFIYLVLALIGKPCNFGKILNITGTGSLIVEPAIRIWDWVVFIAGWNGNLMFLGISHVMLAWPWSIILMAIAYKNMLGIKPGIIVPIGIIVCFLLIPFAAIFLRP